jgi:hypothetical protein
MAPGEVSTFAESMRGMLSCHWSSPTPDSGTDLAALWQAPADAGWLELNVEGALGAVVAAVREFGRVPCPLPLMDSFVTARLFGHDDMLSGIGRGEGRVATSVGNGAETGVRHVEAAAWANHLLPISPMGNRRSPPGAAGAEQTAGLAVPA